MSHQTHADLIKAHGGARFIAERINARPETVRMWQFRRRIPRQAWPEIVAAFPDISLEVLVASEAA